MILINSEAGEEDLKERKQGGGGGGGSIGKQTKGNKQGAGMHTRVKRMHPYTKTKQQNTV